MAHAKQCPQILIVDDEEDAALTFARMVETMGCEATAVTDPLVAVATAERLKAELVFLDIRMPGLSGLDIARALREKYGWQRMRIVAVTGFGGAEHRAATRDAGFDAHVTKPVDICLLESVIHTLLPEMRWTTRPT